MSEQQIVIQYRIDGFGEESDLEKRHEIEELLEKVFEDAGIGNVDGGDIGSGSMNIFLYTDDHTAAEQLIISTLRKQGYLEGAVIAVCPDPEQGDAYQVIWPLEYEGEFNII